MWLFAFHRLGAGGEITGNTQDLMAGMSGQVTMNPPVNEH